MNVVTPINVMSLCTGIAGLDIGVGLALGGRSRTVCYVECEAFCCEILASRMETQALDPAPVWTDLRTFDGQPWRGVVDLLIAGYPCQPFSVVGKRRGSDDPRHLWPHVARIVREVEPGYVFLENVGGHLQLGGREVIAELHEMGYRTAAGLFTAEEVGAPHKRERLFILAHTVGNAAVGAGGITQEHAGWKILGDAEPRPDVFPPGPEDHEAWRSVHPALEPALCGMVDGIPNRVDRLRALGNGVVPLQGAYAFSILWASLQEDIG